MINDKSILFAFVLLIASSFFWSGNFFTGKIASLYDLTPFKLSFLRWSLAFLLLLPFTFRKIILDFNKYKFGLMSIEHNFDTNYKDKINELLVKNNYTCIKELGPDDIYKYNL